MNTQENKTENSEDKEIDFKVDFRKIICDNKILVVVILSFMAVIAELYLIADDKSYNNFGDYFGGVLNPILAFISFIAILWTVALQRKSIDVQSKELKLTNKELELTKNELAGSRKAQEEHTKLFEQQQFETTFFNMLELLSKYSEPEISNIEKSNNQAIIHKNWKIQYHLMLFSLLNHIKQYTSSENKNDKNKYADIVKANLNGEAFISIVVIYEQFINNQNQMYYPYQELKNMIEQYELFDFIKKDVIKNRLKVENKKNILGQPLYDKRYNNILKFFKLSAFENNYDLLADRIELEDNSDELKKYAVNQNKRVRLAVAKNKKTPIEILEQLSQDSEEKVRQAAVDTINSLKSQNDENN